MYVLHDHRIPREYLDAIRRKFPAAVLMPFAGPRPGAPRVYDSISSHPDIYFFQIDDAVFAHAPSVGREVLAALIGAGIRLIEGGKDPSGEYPSTALYNAARIGGSVFHNFKMSDRILSEKVKTLGLKAVDVAQGYCACSIVPIGSNALITADAGIAGAAMECGVETLLVLPGEVALPGEKYGFLGGACGIMPGGGVLFLGDISLHPDHDAIRSFAASRRVKIVSLEGLPLLDAGRLIVVENRR